MHYSLRQPASDNLTGTKGSSIFSSNEWDALGCDLKLSPRALPLVRGIFDDKTEEKIAYDLSISVHTVHSYLIRTYQRFGVCSREQLLVYVFGRYLERHRLPESQRSAGQRKRAVKPRVRL
ncbi:MAG: LuxR C-terminal-related transcriptional regulator [Phycisphaerales bacterium]